MKYLVILLIISLSILSNADIVIPDFSKESYGHRLFIGNGEQVHNISNAPPAALIFLGIATIGVGTLLVYNGYSIETAILLDI